MLTRLVLRRCIETNTLRTSRTKLMASVPGLDHDRMCRGFDALIEHGILAGRGDDIGFSVHGNIFLTFATCIDDGADGIEDEIANHPVLTPFLRAIEADVRLNHFPARDAPPRIREVTQFKRSADVTGRWFIAAGGLIAVAILGLSP